MRLFFKTPLLLLFTISTFLTLPKLSLHFTIPGERFIFACVIRAMFALTTISQVVHGFVQRLKAITKTSFKHWNTWDLWRHQLPWFRQLLRAIRFSSAAGKVDAMSRVNELELLIREDISAHNSGDLLLTQKLELSRKKKELIGTTKVLEIKSHSRVRRRRKCLR